jgi:hypothetical protein
MSEQSVIHAASKQRYQPEKCYLKNRRCPKPQQVQSVECSNVGVGGAVPLFVFN